MLFYCKWNQFCFLSIWGMYIGCGSIFQWIESEAIFFPDWKQLHNSGIKCECVVLNVTKILNGYIQLPHASFSADTLLESKGYFIGWDVIVHF